MSAYYLVLERKKSNIKWLIYVVVLFAIGTLNITFNAHFSELAYIDERNYPGGPLAYDLEQAALPILTAGNSASTLGAMMGQIILVRKNMFYIVHSLTLTADVSSVCCLWKMVHNRTSYSRMCILH